eukprot:6191397-Pleurochrysis_carterae.AAC.2
MNAVLLYGENEAAHCPMEYTAFEMKRKATTKDCHIVINLSLWTEASTKARMNKRQQGNSDSNVTRSERAWKIRSSQKGIMLREARFTSQKERKRIQKDDRNLEKHGLRSIMKAVLSIAGCTLLL